MNNKWPSLKQLHYLVTLHDVRHFNRAARACYVSQSTLSSGIQSLEERLGCTLIERDHKSFIFTPSGEEVVTRARELLARTLDVTDFAASQTAEMEGQLRVGCIPTIAPFLLCDLVKQVQQRYPKLELVLREDTTSVLIDALKGGQLDVLLLALPVDIHGLHSRIVGRDKFKMVLPKALASQLHMPLDFNQLPDGSVYLLEREHCLTEHALTACHLAYSDKINPFTATSLHTLVQMVANGLGTTFVPQMAIRQGLVQNLDLVITDPPHAPAYRDIGLVWRPSSSRVNTFSKLGEIVGELLNE